MINYDLFPNPTGRSGENTGFYPRCIATDVHDIERICENITLRSTFTASDVIGLLDAFVHEIQVNLLTGSIIRFPGLGTFKLSLSSTKPITSLKKTKNKNICIKKIIFRPASSLLFELKVAQFNRVPHYAEKLPESVRWSRILSFLKKNALITINQTADINNCTRETALKDLVYLIDTKKIEERRIGRYRLFYTL